MDTSLLCQKRSTILSDLITLMTGGLSHLDPHHLHPKGNKPVLESPMVGFPSQDIPRLITLILDEIF